MKNVFLVCVGLFAVVSTNLFAGGVKEDYAPPPSPQQTQQYTPSATTGLEGAINRAAETLINELSRNATVAVLSVSSRSRDDATFVVDELEFQFVDSRKFKVVDRKTLDTIRSEQNFQLSGDVDDNSAVDIGRMLGASVVITGSITGSGSSQRLTIKALDVKTAQIITMARESF